MPQCGFSRASVQILGLQGVDPTKFAAVNVLESDEVRQGLLLFLSSFINPSQDSLQVIAIVTEMSDF